MLDASLEKVGGLEEGGGEDPGAKAGDEMECWVLIRLLPRWDSRAGPYKMMPALVSRLTCPKIRDQA